MYYLLARSGRDLIKSFRALRDAAGIMGPNINENKTKCMVVNRNKRYGHNAHTFSRLMLIVLFERFISISSGFQMTGNNIFLAVYLLI